LTQGAGAAASRLRILLVTIAALLVGGALALAYRELRELQAAQTMQPGPIDIGFAQFMSLHHQQAIGMAQLILDGRPTPLAGLARSIAYAQLVELGEMRGWLRLWDQPLRPASRSMVWMLSADTPPDAALLQYLLDCERSPTGMPGLATDEELNRLRALDGRVRDERFLQLMLAHHEGGLPMAQFAAKHARLAVVRTLAARIVVEQSEEVVRIRRTLAAMAAPTPG